jgi:hypothetical protein
LEFALSSHLLTVKLKNHTDVEQSVNTEAIVIVASVK